LGRARPVDRLTMGAPRMAAPSTELPCTRVLCAMIVRRRLSMS
jgi:hypothetical protein